MPPFASTSPSPEREDLHAATFRINRSWFIPVATGGRCFIAEADASPGSLGQALCSAEMDDDLDIYEAGQGLTMLCTVALAKVDSVQVDP